MRVCKHCGESEEDHHVFEAVLIPKGCKCNPSDWRDLDNIPKICDNYAWSIADGHCGTCEHDKECHEIKAAEKGRHEINLTKREKL